MYKNEGQKSKGMVQLVEMCHKQKQYLTHDPVFGETMDRQVLTPLIAYGTNVTSNYVPGKQTKSGLLTNQLLEAEILDYMLPEFKLVESLKSKKDIEDILKGLVSYLGPQTKVHKAEANARSCFWKIVNSIHPNYTIEGLNQAIRICHVRHKHQLLDLLREKIATIAQSGDEDSKQSVGKIMLWTLDYADQMKKGTTVAKDMQSSLKALAIIVYNSMEDDMVKYLPHNSMNQLYKVMQQ